MHGGVVLGGIEFVGFFSFGGGDGGRLCRQETRRISKIL